jgi:ElaA protein
VELIVRPVRTPAERVEALDVRRRVFVDEQGVDAALEHDEHDAACEHLIALAGGRVVAAARYRRTERGVKLERVAVLAELRGCGVGSALVRHAIAELGVGSELHVHAQQSALGFWQRMGFVAHGPEFREADIPHRFMRLVTPAVSG